MRLAPKLTPFYLILGVLRELKYPADAGFSIGGVTPRSRASNEGEKGLARGSGRKRRGLKKKAATETNIKIIPKQEFRGADRP